MKGTTEVVPFGFVTFFHVPGANLSNSIESIEQETTFTITSTLDPLLRTDCGGCWERQSHSRAVSG